MRGVRVVRRGRRRLIPIRELERWLGENAALLNTTTAEVATRFDERYADAVTRLYTERALLK